MKLTPDEEALFSAPFEQLIGRVVIFVDHVNFLLSTQAQARPTLFLDTGKAFAFELEGDCCSVSEFTPEGLEAFRELQGAKILRVEEREGGTAHYDGSVGELRDGLIPHVLDRTVDLAKKHPPTQEVDTWHFLVFTTDRGHVTIDWRNSSNGYYDGTCTMIEAEPLPAPAHDAALEGNYNAARLVLEGIRAERTGT